MVCNCKSCHALPVHIRMFPKNSSSSPNIQHPSSMASSHPHFFAIHSCQPGNPPAPLGNLPGAPPVVCMIGLGTWGMSTPSYSSFDASCEASTKLIVLVLLTAVFSACHQLGTCLCWETYWQNTVVIGNLRWLVDWTLPLIPLLWCLMWGIDQTDGLSLINSSLFDSSLASNLSVSLSLVLRELWVDGVVQLPWIELGCWVVFYRLFGQIPLVNYIMLDDTVQWQVTQKCII